MNEKLLKLEKKTFLCYLGAPGSGKSTQALKLKEFYNDDCVIVNRDRIRERLGCWGASNWSPDAEKTVVQERNFLLRESMKDGVLLVISDDTNYAQKNQNFFQNLAKEFGYEFVIEDLSDVPLEVCIERDSKREGNHKVGEAVIRNIAKNSGRYSSDFS